jgi:hypothetical protein
MLKAARAFKPDRVVVLGDFVDCASISHHSKDPTRVAGFQNEIDDANLGLDDLESLGAKKYDFVEGNHEYWLPRLIQDRAPELAGLRTLTIPSLLRLRERGWSYTPYRKHLRVGHLYITHETGKAGANAHVHARNTFESNAVIGHSHRLGVHYSGNAQGKCRVGAMFGWLGDVDQIDYAHRIQALRDWQLGFGVGYLEPSGVIHLQAVPIINNRCVVDGRLIRGE